MMFRRHRVVATAIPPATVAVAATLLLASSTAQAQYRAAECPRLDTYTVTADGPPRPVACLIDGSGEVRAAILTRGSLGEQSIAVYNETHRYNSPQGNPTAGRNILDVGFGQRVSRFDELDPATRMQLDRLLGTSTAERTDVAARPPEHPGGAEPAATSSTAILARFEYDWRGRVRRKIDEEGIREYIYDGDSNRIVAEYDDAGSLVRSYAWAGDRLLGITAAGATFYALADGLSSIVGIVDAEGQVVATYKYDAWGNYRLRQESFPHLNAYGFTGHRWEPSLGLYSTAARYLDPAAGRFLTQDSFLGTAERPSSLHRYLYADANPLTFVDPSGHESVRQTWGISEPQDFWSAFGKNVAYNTWNLASLGTLGRQDTLVERFEAGQITDEQYVNRTAINAGSSVAVAVASIASGGAAGAAASALGANAIVAGALAGAAAGIGGQGATDVLEVGVLGTKSAAEIRGPDYLIAGGMGALFGGAAARAATANPAAAGAARAVTVVERAPAPKALPRVAGGSPAVEVALERDTSTGLLPSQLARATQGTPRYPGVDRFRDITLRQGTIVRAGEPGLTGFFTTTSAARRAGHDATRIFEGLQVAPRQGVYRPGLGAYRVVEDTPAAFGITRANPQYGAGGLPQLFIPRFESVLEPIESWLLTNRVARTPRR
jgi:RHS repeat-associated protein